MKDHSTPLISDASRRDFFKQLVLGGTGLYLSPLLFQSCTSEDLGRPPFGIWEDMIKMLEQSPDHLIGRRKALVASKDPKAMTDFVRDSFQAIPSYRDFLSQIAHYTQYGTEMALRCGLATPREKAEILKDMLVEAGFEAKVVWEHTNISLEEAKAIVFKKYIPEFDPPISNRKMRRWHKALDITETGESFEVIPDCMEKSEALAHDLLGKIDKKYIREAVINQKIHKNGVPSVVFTENGEEKYAHVFDPTVPFGQLHPTNEEKEFDNATALKKPKEQNITISLSCRNVMDKWNETTLVSGTWKLSELLGNQLQVQFLNNMTFGNQATKTVSQICNFTPCLALQDIYKDVAYLEERSFLGEPITLEGEKVLERYNPAVLSEEDSAVAIGNIHSFEGKVLPQAYPKVRLELEPKDAEGNIIGGLSASNFELADNGESPIGWMQQNSISPKILLLYDTSLSMPVEYRGKGIKEFLVRTENMIREAYPSAKIILQETGSNVYTSLLNAKQVDADLILYATDGHNSDEYDESYQSIYDAGPPAILLNVFSVDTFYKPLRENMDFVEIAADDQEKTIAEIKNFVGQLKFPTYVLTYNSFDENESHKLMVKVKGTEHQIELPFTFPKNENILGNRMIGLYLTIKGTGLSPIKRVLAGYEPDLDKHGNALGPNRQMIDEVHQMLLGGAVMSFEREAPTLSLQLTEYLKTLMSNREWFEAFQDNETDMALEALGKGTLSYPSILLTMMQPLQDQVTENAITYPSGFRTCLIKCIPGYYSKTTRMSFDYMPTSEYLSVTYSGLNTFEETVKKTAQLAILEAHMFNDSAYSQLYNKPLLLNKDRGNHETFVKKALKENFAYFYPLVYGGSELKFMDTTLQTRSFWKIDPLRGELYGILPDQTGGGSSSTEEQLRNLETVMKEYNKILTAIKVGMAIPGIGSAPLSIVAAYSFTLVRLYAIASEAIILMSTEKMDEQLSAAMQQLACNVLKAITVSRVKGPLSKGNSGIEFLIAAMGSNAPIC